MPNNKNTFVDCIMCGYCCGYRRESYFGGCSYSKNEEIPSDVTTVKKGDEYFIPVDDDDTCIYLVKKNNGFAKCGIHDKKPRMCKLYNCLTEKKVNYSQIITEHLKERCE